MAIVALTAEAVTSAGVAPIEPESIDTLEAAELNPIVVTGTGLRQHLKNTPTPVAVISGKDLHQTGITDFQDAITMMAPSISFSPNAMGSYLRLNGLTNSHVLILQNGRKVTGDISGNVDLGQIDINRVKRIEILNGSASTLYGSDAIGGVINIITDEPTDDVEFNSYSRYTRNNQFNQSINMSLHAGQLGSYTSFTHSHSDGWQNSNMTEDNGKLTESIAQLSLGYTSNLFTQKFTWDPSHRLTVYAEGTYYHRILDRPAERSGTEGGTKYNTMSEGGTWNAGASYRLAGTNRISLDYSGNTYSQYYKYMIPTGNFNVGDYYFTKCQVFHDVTLKGIFEFADNNNTVIGLDWRRDYLDRPESNLQKGLYTASSFIQHEIKLFNHFTALGGIRFDSHQQLGSHLTPKAAIMYNTGNVNIRVNYAAGYRVPGIDELYYRMLKPMGSRYTITFGNRDLKAETSNYVSVNLEYTSSRISASVTGYLNFVKNMVTSKSTKFSVLPENVQNSLYDEFPEIKRNNIPLSKLSVKEYYNFNKAHVKGIEVNVNAILFTGMTVGINYSLTHGRGLNSDGSWQRLNRSVTNSATVNANYAHSWTGYKLNVSLIGRLQSRTYYPGDDDGNAPGYGLWNINTRHTFNGFRSFTLIPGIGIDNIFNRRDNRPLNKNFALYSPGRSIMVSLAVNFK